jgi:hypothetical protein
VAAYGLSMNRRTLSCGLGSLVAVLAERMLNRTSSPSIWPWILGVALAITFALKSAAHSELDGISSAVNYCRDYSNTIKLSEDRTVLCFDGSITADRDVSAFNELKRDGLFVVRSPGGFAPIAIILSNILLEKNATVVAYDYCLSACANHFFVASFRTYVVKNTIVAWHGGATRYYCGTGDIERLRKLRDESPDREAQPSPELTCKTGELLQAFFKVRGIDERHIHKPQTTYTKKMVYIALREAADKRRIFWMWHPRNHADYFKSRITYESYPDSQEDVNETIRRMRSGSRIIYDPPDL